MEQPKLIGLTGGIGSGKSTVAKVFRVLGVPVFNSDDVAKDIINNDVEAIELVIAEFGDVYQDGFLNKEKLATIVFKDKTALEKLNKIIHPKVAECFEKWIDENKKSPILIKEAAILIETGAYKQLDKLVLVTAPEKLRIDRVIKRDNTIVEKVVSRIKAQLSETEKQKVADYIIVNDDKLMVVPQVLELYQQLLK
ncbi:MAG: dephospho-CoA kinase [Vicingaceae bacterium]|nr:dephospho-CoA kinase [Vicingaceae bacterium]